MTPIRVATLSLAALSLGLAATAHAAPQGKKLYCWEEEGRKICGDALPADAADNARTEFNARTGSQVGEVARAMTAEERAAYEAAQAEAARQAKDAAEQARRELAMVESYATEGDLRRAFDNRIALMDDKVQGARLAIGSLRESLLSRLQRAAELELAGKPVDADLAGVIGDQHAALLRQRGILADLQAERAALDAELESAVARYRELTAPPPASEG